MCGSSLCGNREISGSTIGLRVAWSVAGRRGTVAVDERPREVRSQNSSDEADEQSRATGGGVGGAKAGNQGERGSAKHAPVADPGSRDPGAGPRTARRKAKEEGTVHRAPPPRQRRRTPDRVLRAKAQSRPRGGWRDMARLRGRPRT